MFGTLKRIAVALERLATANEDTGTQAKLQEFMEFAKAHYDKMRAETAEYRQQDRAESERRFQIVETRIAAREAREIRETVQ